MKDPGFRFTFIAAALIAIGGIYGCGSSPPSTTIDVAASGGHTGGAKGGKGGSTGTGGSTAGGSGDGSNDSDPTDGAVDGPDESDGPGGADAGSGTGGSGDPGGNGDPDAGNSAGGSSGFDAGPTGAVASCAKDPSGMTTCRQLEIACENCPPGGAENKNPTAKLCFDLTGLAWMGKASDADCAKFAVDHKCTVDPGGNICATLDCNGSPGCDNKNPDDKTACYYNAHYGNASACKKFVAKCGCK